jgi:hypothetical protein
MTESPEDTLVAQLAAPMIADVKRQKKFKARNRSSWNRMNRPCKAAQLEVGAAFVNRLLKRIGI